MEQKRHGPRCFSDPDSLRSAARDVSPGEKIIVGAIDRHTACMQRHDEGLTTLGGVNRDDADFVGRVVKGSGLRGATRYDRCPKVFLSTIALSVLVIYWL